MSSTVFSFDSPLEWRLAGTPDMAKAAIRWFAEEYRPGGVRFSTEEARFGPGLPGLTIRVSTSSGSGPIGMMHLDALPGQRTCMRVPPRGGGGHDLDPGGELFSAFLSAAVSRLQDLGFLAGWSRFESRAALETARRELDAADESTSFANIGNTCRAALIALANELYAPHMLPNGKEEPKGNDAVGKLRLVASHYFAGRGEDYRDGLNKSIKGIWDLSSALVHRTKNATREDAEVALALVTAVFEAFSFVVPA